MVFTPQQRQQVYDQCLAATGGAVGYCGCSTDLLPVYVSRQEFASAVAANVGVPDRQQRGGASFQQVASICRSRS